MKSFAILRTNVGLTTNIKIMVESDYRLSLESIDTNERLSSTKLKKVNFNKKNYYDELVAYFYKDFPSELAFQIKYEGDNSTMIDSYDKQYDEIYQYGARNIIDNKNYIEEYEYFAPIYINASKLPKKFIIFRVEGPGIEILNPTNFNQNILKKLKTVKVFDLEKTSALGEWLETNYKSNISFPHSPLEMDFRNLEFCRWNGIDYDRGGYITKSLFIDDILDEEKELFVLDKFIFDSWRNNKLVFPNILNFSFLFDDTPATPEIEKKWTLNRYLGFYLDEMQWHTSVSPYITPFLRGDVEILSGNVIFCPSNEDPFIEGFSTTRPFYVEYKGNYYLVEKFAESQGVSLQQNNQNGFVSEENSESFLNKYKIISDLDLSGKQSELNKNYSEIDNNNYLLDYNSEKLVIDEFNSADVWLIEIDGVFHNLIKDDIGIKIITDYSFTFSQNYYTYKVAGKETKVSFVVDFNNPPKRFNIYKLNFTDIKDFDDRIIDTEYSKFEYEKKSELTYTDETKMYLDNLSTKSDPPEIDDFIYEDEVVNIPVSSEYTANFETFKIEKGDLTELWRKNPVYTRWSYQNSLSANDVPYLLNNSILFEDYNRSTNPFDPQPKRIERNLDYFYTINSSTSSYIHHTLHVEKSEGGQLDSNYIFEINKYLGLATYSTLTASATYSYDYFTYFFERKAEFDNGGIKKNVKKYSEFNQGDESIPNITLFRGLEFRLYDVESVTLNSSNELETINVKSSNEFQDYKFSVLLSENKEHFTQTDCFDLEIEQKLIETECKSVELPGCLLTWDAPSNSYFSEDLTLTKYVGWYLNISGTVSSYKVVSATVSIPYVYLVIQDDTTNLVVPSLSLCEACFSKVENRINLPSEYLQTLSPGDIVDIDSDCFSGSYEIFNNLDIDWNFENSISLVEDEDIAPIYFTITGDTNEITYIAEKSVLFYNTKHYYTLYSNTAPVAYSLWDSNDSVWKLWTTFVGGTPSVQLAYLDFDSEYPIGNNWINVSVANLSYNSEFRAKVLSVTCSGTICHTNDFTNNDLQWETIEQWQMDKEYATHSLVLHEDILYRANSYIDMVVAQKPTYLLNLKQIKTAPWNIDNFDYYNPTDNIFWSPEAALGISGLTYTAGDFILNQGEYYQYSDETSSIDFWNPEIAKTTTGYNDGDIVLFKGDYYISLTSSNNYSPDYIRPWYQGTSKIFTKFWKKTSATHSIWKPIELWNPSTTYNIATSSVLIVHKEVIYQPNNPNPFSPFIIESGEEPGISTSWIRLYSLVPDTNLVYKPDVNPIIEMNNRYYICRGNFTNTTLENGINIYINKKWKNVLVNIAINDNTLPKLANCDRDDLYNELYSKLTAYNFIQSINDISNKYGFTDYIKYTIIDESGNIKIYDFINDIQKLPYLLKCEFPDELRVKIRSLEKKQIESPAELKPFKVLNNSKIKNLAQLNWYNGVPVAYEIKENKFPPKVIENLNGNVNYEIDLLYRFSGYYMPLFYEVQIFEKNFEYKTPGNWKFDTTLSDFAIMKERKLRKVNHNGSVLKLREINNYKSIYPMLGEFGYNVEDFFIFKSTWDLQYHRESVINKPQFIKPDFNFNFTLNNPQVVNDIGQPVATTSTQNQNFTL